MSKVDILLVHAHHLAWMLGPTDDGGETAFGGIIASNTKLHCP